MKKLHSDFTFGFEFEAFGKVSKYLRYSPSRYIEYVKENYDDEDEDDEYSFDYESEQYAYCDKWEDIECNPLNKEVFRDLKQDFYDSVNCEINNFFNTYEGSTHHDGSVKEYFNGYQSFEYASPIFKYTPYNMNKVKKFLSSIKDFNFGINQTCGFHTHISYKGISEYDALWILCYIASDEDYIKEFSTLFVDGEMINFSNERYATTSYLYDINKLLKEKNYISLGGVLNTNKYRVLRIHPQGTLEWRGPRNFINVKNGISRYFDKLYTIIDIMCKALNTPYIFGLSKKNLFDILTTNHSSWIVKNTDEIDCGFIKYKNHTFTSNSRLLKRYETCGMLDDFRNRKIENSSLYSYIAQKNIMKKILKNPLELCNPNYEPILPQLIVDLYMNKDIESIVKSVLDSDKKLSLVLQHSLMKYYPYILKYADSSFFKTVYHYQIIDCLEKISTFDYDLISNILKNIPNAYLENVCISFIRKDYRTINDILDILSKLTLSKNDLSIYRLYKDCCWYSDISMYNDDTFSKQSLKEKIIKMMNDNLLPNQISSFDENYKTLEMSSFTMQDICKEVSDNFQNVQISSGQLYLNLI